VVLDLLVLENMGTLASASLDKTIGLWDINTQQQAHTLRGHDKGVFQLAYHPDYHALISASFEHDAIVWNPYCQLKICKLMGHYSPLVGVAAVPDTPQIITADQGGVLKIWDIRTYNAVQTLYVEDQRGARVSDVSTFAYIPQHKRLACGADRLYFHDSLTSSSHHDPTIADLEPCIRVLHNSYDASFITASGNTVKVWNEEDGSLARVYRNIIPNEITAMCLDDAQKKFILGDTRGNLKTFNYLNGAIMKTQKGATSREITHIEYVAGIKQIIVTACDGCIYLYDETDKDEFPLVKKMSSHKDEITCAAFSTVRGTQHRSKHMTLHAHTHTHIHTHTHAHAHTHDHTFSQNLSLYATGSADGQIFLWDIVTHVQVGSLGGHKTDITALVFLDPYPFVASADNLGNICFWVVRPIALHVGKCILRMMNTAKGKRGGNSEHLPVPALAFWESEGEARLYGADVSGVIKVWDLTSAIKRWGFEPFRPNAITEVEEGMPAALSGPSKFSMYKSYRKAHKAAVANLEQAALSEANLLEPGDVKLIKWWPAHTESIRDLRLISDPPEVGIALVSCSFDKKVAMWDKHGNSIGNLQQGNTKDARRNATHPHVPAWVFCSDMEGRQRATQDNAHRVLEQLAKLRANEQHKKRLEQYSKKVRDFQRNRTDDKKLLTSSVVNSTSGGGNTSTTFALTETES
jgi:WD40 repeat protein